MKILVFYVDKQYFNMVILFLRLRVRRELIIRRDGRAVEGTGLENRRCESIRGFESHSLRQLNFSIDLRKYPRGRRGSPAKGVGRVKSAAEVQILSSAPKREAKKDIEDKTSVFSRLPRPVDQQIYGPYFSDILPCAIHSGRSRTHTIFTLSGISFEAGILLLQDLGLFYSAVETDSPNRKPENKRM